LSDVAAGLWGGYLKKEHCFQVGAALLRRPKRFHRQQKVRMPSTSRSGENIDRVHSLVLNDCWMTVQIIADELQIRKTSVYSILMEDLEMRKICANIVPKLLTPERSCEENNVALTGKP
jgi:hypothetical protein